MTPSSASWTTPLPRISRKKGPTSHPRQITMNRGSTLPLRSMFRCWSALVALAVSLNLMSHHGTIASPSIPAATPPMGWLASPYLLNSRLDPFSKPVQALAENAPLRPRLYYPSPDSQESKLLSGEADLD